MSCNKERGKSGKFPENEKVDLRSPQQLAGKFLWHTVLCCNIAVWLHQSPSEVTRAEPRSNASFSIGKGRTD